MGIRTRLGLKQKHRRAFHKDRTTEIVSEAERRWARRRKWLHRVLPYSKLGDRIFHYVRFRTLHQRRPSRDSMLLNDVLYRLLTSDEIESPLRQLISDKELVKGYISEKVGDAYNIPTIAVLRTVEEIRNFDYPDRCAIKPTHGSGGVILRRYGEPLDLASIEAALNKNYYHVVRERNYRNLEPKIIVEPLVFDSDATNDYKVFCWRGQPGLIQVDVDRCGQHTQAFFDIYWRSLQFSMSCPRYAGELPPPACLDLMLNLARVLSADFSFLRVDFYVGGDQIKVGELTNCHLAGKCMFYPQEAEAWVSELIFGNRTSGRSIAVSGQSAASISAN